MSGPLTMALERWKKGDDSAQFDMERELRPFLEEMIKLVRDKRGTRFKARIDSHAVVNAALKSFLTGLRKDEFPAVGDGSAIRKVLSTMVKRALSDDFRWHRRGKRTPYVEQPPAQTGDGRPSGLEHPNPTPDEIIFWLDDLLRIAESFGGKAVDVLILSVEGLDNNAIKDELDMPLMNVRRTKKLILERLEKED